MFNPLKLITAGLNGVAAAGKGLAKAKGIYDAFGDDTDGNGIPEAQDVLNGFKKLGSMFLGEYEGKGKDRKLVKEGHYHAYKKVIVDEIYVHAKNVFVGAFKAAQQ